MTRNQRKWWYGLVAGFFGGVWTSVDSGLAIMVMAPREFNLDEKLWKTLLAILVLGLLAGIKVAVAYLKQSPLPPMNGDTEFHMKPPSTDMKLIIAITAALVFAYIKTHAAEPPSIPSTGRAAAAAPPIEKAPQPLFHAQEFQIDLNGFANSPDLEKFTYGGGLGVNYFPWATTGFGLEGQTEDTKSAFFDRLGVSLIGRMPIPRLRLAPEFKVGYAYDFETGGNHAIKDPNGHEVFASIGGEWRFAKNVGLGVEVRGVKPLESYVSEYIQCIGRLRFNF